MTRSLTSVFVLAFAQIALGGLHYSGEQLNELPSQWRGFLLDQRTLRMLAVPPMAGRATSPLRSAYEDHRDRLARTHTDGKVTADEAADLGALLVRLGEPDRAMTVLREAHRKWPDHFAIAANLGTASQLSGDLTQAASALDVAVSLAPERWKNAERLHLKLVRSRARETKPTSSLDPLFEKTPSDEATVTAVQLLGLWLPADGRVLWQIGEVAHATGDVATAAAILDGCVGEFGMDDPQLRSKRAEYRERVAAPHDKHQASARVFRFKSTRPLVRKVESLKLPVIKTTGLNPLPWPLLGMTIIEPPFKPAFADYLTRLEGKRVVLTGYMQPTGEDAEQTEVLLIEFPVGCWFCEAPEPTGILLVQPVNPVRMTRDAVRVEGVLQLNRNDPEARLYTISQAKIGPPE
jgi:hypothetical protein